MGCNQTVVFVIDQKPQEKKNKSNNYKLMNVRNGNILL